MEHAKKLTVIDADNGREHRILIEEGPLPYTTRITFGASFTITLTTYEVDRFIRSLAAVATEY